MSKIADKIEEVVATVDHELVVVEAFGEYVKGQIITEAEKIKAILASEWSAHVVKKPKADAPA